MKNWRKFTTAEWKKFYTTAMPEGNFDDTGSWWRGCIRAMEKVLEADSVGEAETVLEKDGWGPDISGRVQAVKAMWKAVGRRIPKRKCPMCKGSGMV